VKRLPHQADKHATSKRLIMFEIKSCEALKQDKSNHRSSKTVASQWIKETRRDGFVLHSVVNRLDLVVHGRNVVFGEERTAEIWNMSRDHLVGSAGKKLFLDTDGRSSSGCVMEKCRNGCSPFVM
jgi:hypothetical protein